MKYLPIGTVVKLDGDYFGFPAGTQGVIIGYNYIFSEVNDHYPYEVKFYFNGKFHKSEFTYEGEISKVTE